MVTALLHFLRPKFRRARSRKQDRRRTNRLSANYRSLFEPLEERRLLTAWVSDHWALVVDVDNSHSVTVGDIVNDGNLPGATPGSIAGALGSQTFGTVTSGAYTGSAAGAGRSNAYATGYTVVELDAFTSYVYDNWVDLTDGGAPDPGHDVDNSNQFSPGDQDYVSTKYLWTNQPSAADGFTSAGFEDLATAISLAPHRAGEGSASPCGRIHRPYQP